MSEVSWSTTETAKYLHCSRDFVHELIRLGALHAVKIGGGRGRYRVFVDSIKEYQGL